MSDRFGLLAASLVRELARIDGSVVSEEVQTCRVDHTSCRGPGRLELIKELARIGREEHVARVTLHGDFQQEIDLDREDLDIGDEPVALLIEKDVDATFRYFITIEGFELAIRDEGFVTPGPAVWLPIDFEAFSAEGMSVVPWGGRRVHTPPVTEIASPRKFVRDELGGTAPSRLDPWLLRGDTPASSAVFDAWRGVAVTRLAYALPSEVRSLVNGPHVVLKGPRSAPIPIEDLPAQTVDDLFPTLLNASRWVYGTSRETETKFQFLNNHLSMDWRDGSKWPTGLAVSLEGSLANAREAYAFHLQDQSKDALKSLGDLRKALQDEVAKAQSATKDLLSALWRDFAIAGVVLALKSPTAPQFAIAGSEVLRWVTLAAAAVLTVSIVVTVAANWRFNRLTDQGRGEWRGKLYAFLSKDDWDRLVEKPIAKARWVYRLTCVVVVLMYASAVNYLLLVAAPEWTVAHIDPWLAHLCAIGAH